MAFGVFLTLPQRVLAVAYDLIPPSGPLQRGQDVDFIIDLDSGGTPFYSGTVGLQYDTQYLQYRTAVQGDILDSLVVTQQDNSTLVLTGTNTAGYNGLGTFATITFTLIATAPGSTQLCTLIEVPTSPTPIPSSPVNPTLRPSPTQLPQSGSATAGTATAVAGILFLIGSFAMYTWLNRKKHAW